MKLGLVSAFLRPSIIFPVPRGQQGIDPTGANGLVGFMQNANSYANSLNSSAVSSANINLTALQVQQGVINLNGTPAANFTVTLPSTSAILGQLGASIPQDGSFSKFVFFVNNGPANIGTLTAGDANTAISGPAILGSNTTRVYMMQVLNSSNISFTNIGMMPI